MECLVYRIVISPNTVKVGALCRSTPLLLIVIFRFIPAAGELDRLGLVENHLIAGHRNSDWDGLAFCANKR